MKALLTAFLSLSLLMVSPAVAAPDQQHTIAVLPFNCSVDSDETADVDVGAEVAKVLSSEISKLGSWEVSDQDDIASLLDQKDSDDLSASQIGRLLKANYVITGNVQSFELQMNPDLSMAADVAGSSSSAALSSVPGVGMVAGLLPFLAMAGSSQSAQRGHVKVVIDAKLIDVHTGKTILVLGSNGISHKGSTSLWGGSDNPNPDFLSKSFGSSAAGQATVAAADAVCTQLTQAEPKLNTTATRIQGTVTDVDDDLICVSVGKADGFTAGDRFIVESDEASEAGTDSRVGVITLTDVGDHTSLAKLADGDESVIAGDAIRTEETKTAAATAANTNAVATAGGDSTSGSKQHKHRQRSYNSD